MGEQLMRTLEDALRDVQRRADQQWKPAANGTETPTRFPDGSTLLYCYNPVLREHAYFDCSTDLQVTDAVMESIITGCWDTFR
jgi:hypothetical protein